MSASNREADSQDVDERLRISLPPIHEVVGREIKLVLSPGYPSPSPQSATGGRPWLSELEQAIPEVELSEPQTAGGGNTGVSASTVIYISCLLPKGAPSISVSTDKDAPWLHCVQPIRLEPPFPHHRTTNPNDTHDTPASSPFTSSNTLFAQSWSFRFI